MLLGRFKFVFLDSILAAKIGRQRRVSNMKIKFFEILHCSIVVRIELGVRIFVLRWGGCNFDCGGDKVVGVIDIYIILVLGGETNGDI